MEFMKKQSAGFFFTLLTVIFAGAGIIFYLINCNTSYFASYGIDSKIIAFACIAIVIELMFMLASQTFSSKKLLDVLPVAAAIVLVIAFVTFVGGRAANIASIMTFENNAQTMADLTSAIIGLVCCFLAVVSSIIASFFPVVKE